MTVFGQDMLPAVFNVPTAAFHVRTAAFLVATVIVWEVMKWLLRKAWEIVEELIKSMLASRLSSQMQVGATHSEQAEQSTTIVPIVMKNRVNDRPSERNVFHTMPGCSHLKSRITCVLELCGDCERNSKKIN